MKPRVKICVTALLLFVCLPAYCQWKEHPATGSPPNQLPDRTTLSGQAGLGPLLIVKLVDQGVNARQHKVVIEVETDGLKMVDPASVNHEPRSDEAHIQYRLDDGPIENSTSKTWTFDNLSAGEHLIRVAVAASDNHQLGREKIFRLRVP